VEQDKDKKTEDISKAERKSLQVSRELACEVARLADDRNCCDVVILELVQSPVARHFVICTGTSAPQIRSTAHEIEAVGKEQGFAVFGRAGLQQSRWAIIDFVDVVVHIFDDEYRKFYDLELLWGDAPRIDWQRQGS
jgi:ribosome-associated protein